MARLTRREEAELAVAEYLLGLDALGLGGKAQGIWERSMGKEVSPLLLRQKIILENSLLIGDFSPAIDGAVDEVEGEIAAAHERLLESLRVLWLTEGRWLESESEVRT